MSGKQKNLIVAWIAVTLAAGAFAIHYLASMAAGTIQLPAGYQPPDHYRLGIVIAAWITATAVLAGLFSLCGTGKND